MAAYPGSVRLDQIDHATFLGLWLNRKRGLYALAQGVKLALDATAADFRGASRGEEWYLWTCENEDDARAIVAAEKRDSEQQMDSKNGGL